MLTVRQGDKKAREGGQETGQEDVGQGDREKEVDRKQGK
jgi:hypothetical protein